MTPSDGAAPLVPGRDRYLDLLRSIALVRIVAFHTFFNAVWLTVIFPSLGVMFALAGALMARSLERPALEVLRSRTRRLLLPFWLYGFTVVGLLAAQGWRPPEENAGGWWLRLMLWIVPLGEFPIPQVEVSAGGSSTLAWAEFAVIALWYIRAYFWFVLLSPLLLMAFRRLPWVTLFFPLVVSVILATGMVDLPNSLARMVYEFATFGSCWVLGFAYQSGFLRSLPRILTPLSAMLIMAIGLWWASGHLPEAGWDLGEIPLAQALWSFGFCVLLLRISPSWSTLPRPLQFLDRAITLINNRAITIYLWHIVLLIATVPLIDQLWKVPILEQTVPWLLNSQALQFAAVWLMLGLVILAVGWVEDIAARRPPRLWPSGSSASLPRGDGGKGSQPATGVPRNTGETSAG